MPCIWHTLTRCLLISISLNKSERCYRSNAPRWNASEDVPASSFQSVLLLITLNEDAGASTMAFQRRALEQNNAIKKPAMFAKPSRFIEPTVNEMITEQLNTNNIIALVNAHL